MAIASDAVACLEAVLASAAHHVASPSRALLEQLLHYARDPERAGILRVRDARPGRLIAKGSLPADVFVLVTGEADVFVHDCEDRPLAVVAAPALLGEIAHLAGGATADVYVRPPGGVLLAIRREEFDAFARSTPRLWHAYQELVSGRLLPHLHGRSVTPLIAHALLQVIRPAGDDARQRALLEKMAQAVLLERPHIFGWQRFEPGTTLIAEGEPIDFVGVLFHGSAVVRKHGRKDIQVGPGSLLGEMSALSGLMPTATVIAGADGAEALVLSRADFQEHVLADAEARAAARELALARLREQYDTTPLDARTEERLRTVRDQNTDALIRRQGIRTVAGDGVYQALNPDGVLIAIGGAHHGPIEQKYALLGAVERLFKSGLAVDDILNAARDVRARHARASRDPHEVVRESIQDFLGYSEQVHALTFAEALRRLRTDEERDARAVVDRTTRVRWLQDRLRADPLVDSHQLPSRSLPELVEAIASGPNPSQALDDEFRGLMELGVRQGSEPLFAELKTVMFQRVELGSCEFDRGRSRQAADGSCAANLRHLRELRDRLDGGEQSAIGGRIYPQQRFTPAVLDAIARGEITVVVYDGSAAGAEEYVRMRYGSDPRTGTRWPGWTTQIQGLDGSGPRTLLTVKLPDASTAQYLTIAGYGAARQLHNAGAVLLYEEEHGRRVAANRLQLATEGIDYVERMRTDIRAALENQRVQSDGAAVLNVGCSQIADLPIQLLILQNPSEITSPWRDEVVIEPARGAMFRFFTGWMRVGTTLVRLLIPKVGGDGLYGDTAGMFVSAAFDACGPHLLPHVIFNGTAGGFACTNGTPPFLHARGLNAIRPGGMIVPVETIEQVGNGRGPRRLRTLFDPADRARPATVNFTSHHAAVAAPAIETYTFIEEELVNRGKASVDVEGGAIWKALEDLERPDVTFTPVYTHSDDPRTSRESPADSLALMGPWFEGVEIDRGKYALLRTLVHRSVALGQRR